MSRALSTPLSVITARLQTEGDEDEEDDVMDALDKQAPGPKGLRHTIDQIYREDGLFGFWRGTSPPTHSSWS